MKRSIPGAFPTSNPANANWGLSLADPTFQTGAPPGQPTRTPGATAAARVGLQGPTPSNKWSFLSFSGTAGLVFGVYYTNVGGNGPLSAFGKLSKITCGLVTDGSLTPSGTPIAADLESAAQPLQAYPSDYTLATSLWDAAIDDMPPTLILPSNQRQIPAVAQTLQINATLLTPIPIDVEPGVEPVLGIWMEPCLLGIANNPYAPNGAWFGLALVNAKYTFNYDDGL